MSEREESVKLAGLKDRNVFMLGIGGCSMSGLALLLKSRGFEAAGTNCIDTEYIPIHSWNRLSEAGAFQRSTVLL